MSTYGSVPGVQAYTRHIRLDAVNNPTSEDVGRWLTERSAQLTAWLAAAEYTVPVTADVSAEAKAILDRYANMGAAGDAELSMRSNGNDGDGEENTRYARFLSEFAKAEAWIASGVLVELGVPRVTASATMPTIFTLGSGRRGL